MNTNSDVVVGIIYGLQKMWMHYKRILKKKIVF